jgi:pantetheine-phosphate adenylyltransferase
MWVVCEGLRIAEKVVIMLSIHPDKKYLFSEDEKLAMIKESLKEYNIEDRVDIISVKNEYVAQSAIDNECEYLIRGIRSSVDFDYERLIQKINHEVIEGARTIFVMPPKELESVSSSTVKALIGPVGWHWNIKNFVPYAVYQSLLKNYISKSISKYAEFDLNQSSTNELINNVLTEYSNPERHYHSLEHLAHCYQELEWLIINYKLESSIYRNVALAIACHDLKYGVHDKKFSDEELSAQWLSNFLNDNNIINRESAVDIILSTAHFNQAEHSFTEEEKIMHDIDLCILAQKNSVYEWYINGVRQEYSYVPDDLFKAGRTSALNKLTSTQVYKTSYFSKYETKAKENINNEIKKLNLIFS